MTTTRLYVPLDRGAGTGDSMVINVAELLKSSRKNAMEEDDKDVAADNSDENDQEDQDEDQEEEQEGVAPNASGEKADKPKKKRRRRVDPEEEYDLDDGWIDDSELFYEVTDGGERSAEGPPVGEDWDYGFFAWRGDVQAFLDEPIVPGEKRTGRAKDKIRRTSSLGVTPAPTTNAAGVTVSTTGGSTSTGQDPQTPTATKKVKLSVTPPLMRSPQKSKTVSSSTTTKKAATAVSSSAVKSGSEASSSTDKGAKGKKNNNEGSNSKTGTPFTKPVAPLPSASTVSTPDLPLLHPKVQMKIDLLSVEAKKESWDNKKQFPPALRSIIQDAAKLAIETRTFSSDAIVPHLTHILPYNTYTMKKLLGKMAIPDELKVLKDEGAATYLLFKSKVEGTVASLQKDMDAEMRSGSTSTVAADGKPSEIKVKWDEDLKALVWNVLCLEWLMARLDNELQTYNKGTPQFSEQSVRRAVYSKMISYWPSGWMDTLSISREYSQQKLRVGKLAEKRGHSGIPPTASGILLRPDPFSRVTYNRDKETPKKEGTPVATPVKESSSTKTSTQSTSGLSTPAPTSSTTSKTNAVPQSAPGSSKAGVTAAPPSAKSATKKEPIKRRNSLSAGAASSSTGASAKSSAVASKASPSKSIPSKKAPASKVIDLT